MSLHRAPWSFVVLELVILICFALTIRHARRDRFAMFQWTVILFYGVMMELLAFNAYDNYEHGKFTVQLYKDKLPLYVTFLYVVFHYTGLKIAEGMRLGRIAEPLAAGVAICLLDVPFDIVGPDAGWWKWSTTDPNIGVKWLGVPITSYYWYLLFGAILSALTRLLKTRVEKSRAPTFFFLAPVVAAAVIVVGIFAFLPFHALKAIGVPQGAIVGAHFVVASGLALKRRRGDAKEMVPILVLLHAWHVALICVVGGGAAKLSVAIGAIILNFVMVSRIAMGQSSGSTSTHTPRGDLPQRTEGGKI